MTKISIKLEINGVPTKLESEGGAVGALSVLKMALGIVERAMKGGAA